MLLFAQVECKQTEVMVEDKNIKGLQAACIGLFICASFMLTIEFLYRTDKIEEYKGVLALVTIEDYTAQTRLPNGLYKEFMDDRRSELTDEHIPIFEFKTKMAETIKHQLIEDENNQLSEA